MYWDKNIEANEYMMKKLLKNRRLLGIKDEPVELKYKPKPPAKPKAPAKITIPNIKDRKYNIAILAVLDRYNKRNPNKKLTYE
jgi:hypothetical protein